MIDNLPARRGRGAGLLLALLGLWGALAPFIGPYFHYAYTPARAWDYTPGRLYLEILPGAAAVLGGLLLSGASSRAGAVFGGLLAAAAGAWFALGATLSPLWNGVPLGGSPAGSTTTMRVTEQVGLFTGLGVAVVLIAAMAIGRAMAVPALPEVPVAVESPAEPAW